MRCKIHVPSLIAPDDDDYDDEAIQMPLPFAAKSAFGTPPQFSTPRGNPQATRDDQRYSLREFVEETGQKDHGEGFFELESPYMLEVNLNGMVWTKMGSMIAYVGNIKFVREGILENGLGKFLKKAVTGEGTKLTKAEGGDACIWQIQANVSVSSSCTMNRSS